MIHNVDAIFENGVFRPVKQLALPDGARVHLRVEDQSLNQQPQHDQAEEVLPTLLERMKDFVGKVENLPPDASINLDHYLYGSPKRQ
jgi:predicted DNA-binding antitoxin AbrB/MazE fold protein